MRIAILSPFYPYRGGIAQFSLSMFRELRKNHTVKVFSYARLYPQFLFPGKSQFVETSEVITDVTSEKVLDSINPFSYEKTVRHISQFQADILIIAYWMSFFSPPLSYIARRLRKKTKIIGLIHNAIPHEPHFFDVPLAQIFVNSCSKCVVLSDSVKKDVLNICPNAVCTLSFHPLYDHFGKHIEKSDACMQLTLDVKKKIILFFGLIRDYKGLDLLIEAMKFLDNDFQLVIAGECYGKFDLYQNLIDKSPAKDRIIIFNRYISDTEIPLFFSAADLLVLPYKSATQSGVIPVACHFELPVVVTDVGGLRATVEEMGIGLVCMPEAHDISKTITAFFKAEKFLFQKNFNKVKKILSWENFCQSLF